MQKVLRDSHQTAPRRWVLHGFKEEENVVSN